MESPARSLVKAICWNILGLVVMCLVGLVMTGSLALGGAMAVLNTSIGFVCYLFYERLWARVHWGRHG
ncbi:DUF2061 domain-containing protein [Rhodobacteraceae bacterium D3-12]|nr:DUF2061 domain-containing protein [Rhodobacteraceae bacterium D3-12]